MTEWRAGNEKDIDEVLQIHTVFANVSKGVQAKKADLGKAFGEKSEREIVEEILKKGQVQLGEKERGRMQEEVFLEVASLVASMCINPETQRPYPQGVIETAIKEMHYGVVPNRPAKKQALEIITHLKAAFERGDGFPIERASMLLLITAPSKEGKRVKSLIVPNVLEVVEEDWGSEMTMECLVQPGAFRVIDDIVQKETRGQGSVEVLNLNVQQDGEDELLE